MLIEVTSSDSFRMIITDPIIKKLNNETKVLLIKGLGKKKGVEEWLKWIQESNKKQLDELRSFLSNSGRIDFYSLENLASRI